MLRSLSQRQSLLRPAPLRCALRRRICTEQNSLQGASETTSLLDRARKHMSINNRLSKLSHFSNISRFLGLASPDLLVLQSFMVVASSTNGLYNLLQPKPLYVPFSYGAAFTLLSASIVARIASERFVTLTEEEQQIYDEHFAPAFGKPKFKKLIDLSKGVEEFDGAAGHKRIKVMRKGERADLFLLLNGDAEITFHEPRQPTVVPRGPGLIGEIGFTRAYGQNSPQDREAVADIDMVGKGSRWLSWDGDTLRQAMAKDAELKKNLDHLVGLSLASKLRSAYLDGATASPTQNALFHSYASQQASVLSKLSALVKNK